MKSLLSIVPNSPDPLGGNRDVWYHSYPAPVMRDQPELTYQATTNKLYFSLAHQIKVVKFHAIRIGLCSVNWYLLAVNGGRNILDAILDDFGVPANAQQCVSLRNCSHIIVLARISIDRLRMSFLLTFGSANDRRLAPPCGQLKLSFWPLMRSGGLWGNHLFTLVSKVV